MKFDLYTHGDFDGLVSGAIMYKFCLESGLEPGRIEFVNYSTHAPSVWDNFPFDNSAVNVVTDYLFSPALLESSFFVW